MSQSSKAALRMMARRRVPRYYDHPRDIVISRGQGVHLYDMDGKPFFDLLAGFGACSLGHSHPEMVRVLSDQASKVALTSRAVLNDVLPQTAEFIASLLGYDKFLPSSSGVEACETAVKLARRYGYVKRGIPHDEARVLLMDNCFWGRSITACSGNDERSYRFGPQTPNFDRVPYDDMEAVRSYLEKTPYCVAVMLEPIQGEAGTIVPGDGFVAAVKNVCSQYGVLLVCDEVQSGLGRTGHLMGYHHDLPEAGNLIKDTKPDIVTLGKALSAGYYASSGCLANNDIMDLLNVGEHGSTFGGNPLAMRCSQRAVQLLFEHDCIDNARRTGEIMRNNLRHIANDFAAGETAAPPFIVRGRGQMNAIEVNTELCDPQFLCASMLKHGLLTRVSGRYKNTLRLTPPLIISEAEVEEVSERLRDAMLDVFRGPPATEPAFVAGTLALENDDRDDMTESLLRNDVMMPTFQFL